MSYWNNELHIFQKGVEMVELILLGDTPRPHSLLFSGAEKRSKRDIHPYPTSPYMGKLKKISQHADDIFYILVSRDDAISFLLACSNHLKHIECVRNCPLPSETAIGVRTVP